MNENTRFAIPLGAELATVGPGSLHGRALCRCRHRPQVTETVPQEFTADTHLEGDLPSGVADLPQGFGPGGDLIAHLHT